MDKPILIILSFSTARGGIDQVISNYLSYTDLNIFKKTYLFTYLKPKNLLSHKSDMLDINILKIQTNKLLLITNYLKLAFQIKKFVKEERQVLINTHELVSNMVGKLIRFIGKKNVVLIPTVHQLTFDRPVNKIKKRIYYYLDKTFYENVDGIIAVAEFRKKQLINNFKIKNNMVVVIYNGVPENIDLKNQNHSLKFEKHKYNHKLIFGYCGRLSPEKGVNRLLRSISLLNTDLLSKIHLLIAGDGVERIFLEKLCEKLEITKNVSFLGFINDLKNFYGQLDLLIQPSYDEGISLAILEAMSYGIPVLASNVGGNPELVENNINGWLFQNEQELSQIITKIISNRDLFSGKENECILHVTREFNLTKTVNETNNYFKTMIKNRFL
jgi:glycosyltransferase involved in cell wall biosynthesis